MERCRCCCCERVHSSAACPEAVMNESLADKDLYNKIRQHDSQRIHTLLYIERCCTKRVYSSVFFYVQEFSEEAVCCSMVEVAAQSSDFL
jgi:hypothetical protein